MTWNQAYLLVGSPCKSLCLLSAPTPCNIYHSFEVWFLIHYLLLLHMISSLLSLLNNFFFIIFKASFVATTTSIPVSFVCCCRTSCRTRGGPAALLSIICCCSQIHYEVSTQLGITSSSTHGMGDQPQPWAPAADSKPAVRCWWSTCASSDPGFRQSRALSATGKRIGKTPPISSEASSRVCCTWAGANCHPSRSWCSVAGSRSRSEYVITRCIIKDCRSHGWVLD